MKTNMINNRSVPSHTSRTEKEINPQVSVPNERPATSGPLSQLSKVRSHYIPKSAAPFDSKNTKPPVDRHANMTSASTSPQLPPSPAVVGAPHAENTDRGLIHDARHQNLVGQTISPKVAERFLDKVEFDGIGRILGFPSPLSKSQLTRLENARIRPLTETNTLARRDAPRSERDALIHFIHLTQDVDHPAAHQLNHEARSLWISGVVNQKSLQKLLTKGSDQLGHLPRLQDKLESLVNDTAQLKTLPQYHDNIYGRKFETALVAELVNDPPHGTLAAATRINQEVHAHLMSMPAEKASEVLQKVAKGIVSEPRPWYPLKPEIEQFAAAPTNEAFQKVLGPAKNGIDVIASINLAHRVWTAGIEPPPWAEAMNQHYNELLVPRRGKGRYLTEFDTNAHGIAALHHPDNLTYSTFQTGKSWTYKRSPEMDKPTDFENNTLKSGHIFVSGPSGTTNVLAFTSADIARRDPTFSPNDALLAGVMFMTMDTGHSVHEVLATNLSIQARGTEAAGTQLTTSAPPYKTLAELPTSPADKAKVESAMNRALDTTIAHFENIWSPTRTSKRKREPLGLSTFQSPNSTNAGVGTDTQRSNKRPRGS